MRNNRQEKTVFFDNRAVLIDGHRALIFSGAVHYTRSTPEMWPRILSESKRAGLNTIETYVFWEQHEPQEGMYDFSDRRDLGRFLDLCHEQGLYVILRIGPYVCAETNFGGLPWWLITKPGIVTRTLNKPFMDSVDGWMRRLLAEIGDRQITRGGPIILAQLENEYSNVSARYGTDGQKYLEWCVQSGRNAGLEVPLIMCEGAPEGVISTLNGFSVWSRMEALRKERTEQPILWTEAWTGWYNTWGDAHHIRPTEDIAYELLRFFAIGGTGVNHYMWHGGTNFERDGMYTQAASYDFDAPIDEYGLPTDKSERLGILHRMLQTHSDILLYGERLPPEVLIRGDYPQNADGVTLHAFKLDKRELILVINGNDWPKTATVRGVVMTLPHKTAVIMLGSHGEYEKLYSTADRQTVEIKRKMEECGKCLVWKKIAETPCPSNFKEVTIPHNMLLSTRDETDYGWYAATLQRKEDGKSVLRIGVADRATVWVNGKPVGSQFPERLKEDRKPEDFSFEIEVPLRRGENKIVILVNAVGLIKGDWGIDAPQSEERRGLIAPVLLDGEPLDVKWKFAAGLVGERSMAINGVISPELFSGSVETALAGTPVWFETSFDVSDFELEDSRPWAFDATGLGKGMMFINGRMLCRYWQLPAPDARHARHNRHPHLVTTGHEMPTQRFYHIPADWLRPGCNSLVLLEELGASPEATGISRRC